MSALPYSERPAAGLLRESRSQNPETGSRLGRLIMDIATLAAILVKPFLQYIDGQKIFQSAVGRPKRVPGARARRGGTG